MRPLQAIFPAFVCFLFCLFSPSNAFLPHLLPRAVQENPALCNARLKKGECGFAGNPDMYGLGLRLGVYLQWLACNLSLTFVAHPEKDLPDASLVYSFAIALAIILTTFQDTCVYFVEAFILINIAFGGTLHLDLTRWERGSWRRPALLVFYLIVFPYSCWFWRQGMQKHFQDTPCGTQLFLFGRISGSHLTVALNVFLAISIILTVVVGYSSVVQLISVGMTWMRLKPPKWYLWQHRMHDITDNKEITPRTYLLFTLLMLYMAYIITTIELTLKWNRITGINSLGSVGQIFPFIISILNFLRVLFSIYEETKRKMRGVVDVEGNSVELVLTHHPNDDKSGTDVSQRQTRSRNSSDHEGNEISEARRRSRFA